MPEHLSITVRNAMFQRFETLKRNREKRHRQKLAFVEGVHPFEQAILHGWEFEAIGFAAGKRLSGWAEDMLKKAKVYRTYAMDPKLYAEISERDQPCELVGLVRMREDGLERMAMHKAEGEPLYVIFDRPQGPGNLGTVIRLADAFGAAGILTTGHSADFYDPLCIRASIGTCFARPFAAMESVVKAIEWIHSLSPRPQIVGTSARGNGTLQNVDLTGPTIMLMGNETFGLSKAWKEVCDVLVKIPIYGSASSLNVGCAASICLYEVARQRGMEES